MKYPKKVTSLGVAQAGYFFRNLFHKHFLQDIDPQREQRRHQRPAGEHSEAESDEQVQLPGFSPPNPEIITVNPNEPINPQLRKFLLNVNTFAKMIN